MFCCVGGINAFNEIQRLENIVIKVSIFSTDRFYLIYLCLCENALRKVICILKVKLIFKTYMLMGSVMYN